MQDVQKRSKFYADQRRSVREFEVGQKVFLEVTPKCSRLKLGRSKKLSFRFCGPFQIIKRIGQVAYALDLPKDRKIYNVSYESLLRRYVSDPNHVLSNLLQVVKEGEMLVELERICKFICNTSGIGHSRDLQDYPEDEASWKLENKLKKTNSNFVIVDNDLIWEGKSIMD